MPISNVELIHNKNEYAITIVDSHNNLRNIVHVTSTGLYSIQYYFNGKNVVYTGRIVSINTTLNNGYILFDRSTDNRNIRERILFANIINIIDETPNDAYRIAVEHGFEGTVEDWLEYLKGKSAYEIAVANGFRGTEKEWLDSLKGSGSDGSGADGKSAYQIAVDNGFEGDEKEWLTSLKGERGDTGPAGPQGEQGEVGPKGDKGNPGEKGETGPAGVDGKSAYQIAVDNGFEGSEEEWLASLKGEKGDKGDPGSNSGSGGSGIDGKSAYQIAVDNGFEGDEKEWLTSLKGERGDTGPAGPQGEQGIQGEVGPKGDIGEQGPQGIQGETGPAGVDGKSAYQIAVDNGFEGSEKEWLESLKTKNNDVIVVNSFEEISTTTTNPIEGDVALVISSIGSTGKTQYIVYKYISGEWIPLNTEYDASRIILPEDWVTTTKIGVIDNLTGGKAVIANAGSTLMQALHNVTLKELNPTITNPTITLNSGTTSFKAYEAGSVIPITIAASLNDGSYSYGSKDSDGKVYTSQGADITASGWEFKDSNNITKTSTDGRATFDSVTVRDASNQYRVEVKANYDASKRTPLTNAGNLYEAGKIKAGSATKYTEYISGYRNCFYGTINNKNSLTSDIIRSLTPTNGAVSKGKVINVPIPVGAMRVVIAYDASISGASSQLASVLDVNGLNAQINTAFTCLKLDVEGANGYNSKTYNIFVLDFANANDKANTYIVTL